MQNESGQVKRKKWFLRWWMFPVYFIVFMIILVVVASNSTPSPKTAPTQPVVETAKPPIVVTADKLMDDYTANEVAADAKYKNNTVQVSGIVDSIGKDILDTPYISLHAGGQYSFSVVQCMFAKSDEAALASVSKGQSMTLTGQVTGKLGNVIINGCRIVK